MKKSNMMFWRGTAMSALMLSATSAAWAAPDENNAPKAANPDNKPAAQFRERIKESLAQRNQKRAEAVRARLVDMGFAEPAVQDAVITHLKSEQAARETLRENGRKIARTLRAAKAGQTITDTQLTTFLAEYRAAQEADEARRNKAEAALDAQIKYTSNARLEATLVLLGAIGGGPELIPMGGGGQLNRQDRPNRPRNNRPRNNQPAAPNAAPAQPAAPQGDAAMPAQ